MGLRLEEHCRFGQLVEAVIAMSKMDKYSPVFHQTLLFLRLSSFPYTHHGYKYLSTPTNAIYIQSMVTFRQRTPTYGIVGGDGGSWREDKKNNGSFKKQLLP